MLPFWFGILPYIVCSIDAPGPRTVCLVLFSSMGMLNFCDEFVMIARGLLVVFGLHMSFWISYDIGIAASMTIN